MRFHCKQDLVLTDLPTFFGSQTLKGGWWRLLSCWIEFGRMNYWRIRIFRVTRSSVFNVIMAVFRWSMTFRVSIYNVLIFACICPTNLPKFQRWGRKVILLLMDRNGCLTIIGYWLWVWKNKGMSWSWFRWPWWILPIKSCRRGRGGIQIGVGQCKKSIWFWFTNPFTFALRHLIRYQGYCLLVYKNVLDMILKYYI